MAQEWHRSTALYEAVERFHQKYARQPSEMERARVIHERNKREIEEALRRDGICLRLEYTGSSYEGVKVAKSPTNPDLEFDIMVIMKGGNYLIATPVPDKSGFVTLNRKSTALTTEAMLKNVDPFGNMLTKETIKDFFGRLHRIINASANMSQTVRLINHGPAVQMDVYEQRVGVGAKFFSVDVVPTYEVGGAMYVAKPVGGDAMLANAWRRSFSLDEKRLFDAMDGPDNGCRKKVLRVLKVLRNREAGLAQLTSYHLKTALFKEVEALPTPNWQYNQVGVRLMGVLGRLEQDLTDERMQHKFTPEINLLSRMSGKSIENMRDRIKRWRSSQKEFLKILNS